MTLTGEMITFPGSSMPQLNGYLVRPEGDGPFPGLVVIHEAYGLREDIERAADRFAGAGYVTLAVDLYGDRNMLLCIVRMMGSIVLNSLDHAGVRDLKAALTHLAQLPGVDAARLGAVGFCMGGSLAIALSCVDNRLKAIAPYYAMNPRPLGAVARACPVVGSYPDPDFTTKAGRKLDQELDKHAIDHDIKIYPEAKHSFFTKRASDHDKAAADDSWRRVLAFFEEHIR